MTARGQCDCGWQYVTLDDDASVTCPKCGAECQPQPVNTTTVPVLDDHDRLFIQDKRGRRWP